MLKAHNRNINYIYNIKNIVSQTVMFFLTLSMNVDKLYFKNFTLQFNNICKFNFIINNFFQIISTKKYKNIDL